MIEIIIIILAYLFFCFTSFAVIYSGDTVNLWGNAQEKPSLYMPELKNITNISANEYGLQNYVNQAIRPAILYFHLRNEIEQAQNIDDIIGTFFLLLFPPALSAVMLIKAGVFAAWLISILVAIAVFAVSFLFINLIYTRSKICSRLRITHFNYDIHWYRKQAESDDRFEISYTDKLNNIIICQHYNYLSSIRDTIVFRHSIRKILVNVSFVVYFLFFFTIPEY